MFKYAANYLSTMSQVTVSQYTKDMLIAIQTDEEHTSIDSVLRTLIMRNDYNKTMHTISDEISYAVCLDAVGLDSSPDDPALIVMSGKTIRASLEDHQWCDPLVLKRGADNVP